MKPTTGVPSSGDNTNNHEATDTPTRIMVTCTQCRSVFLRKKYPDGSYSDVYKCPNNHDPSNYERISSDFTTDTLSDQE